MFGRRALLKGAMAMPFGQAKTQGFAQPVLSNFAAGNVRINSLGEFLYSGPPALGNLIYSNVTSNAVIFDKFGNRVFPGVTTYFNSGGVITADNVVTNGTVRYTYFNPAGPLSGLEFQDLLEADGLIWQQQFRAQGIAPGSIWNTVFPSGDTTGTTDYNNIINSLLTGVGPVNEGLVFLVPGVYYISQPVVMPDNSCLIGRNPSWGIPTGNYGAGSLPLQGSIIRAGSSFVGGALIQFNPLGGTIQHGGQRIENITLSGASAPANTHGIASTGYVGGVKLRNIVIWGNTNLDIGMLITDDGTAGHNPDFWQIENVKCSNCSNFGAQIKALSDSWIINSEFTGNTNGGLDFTGGADTRFIGCRADSNGSVPGWNLHPTQAGNLIEFTNCEANLNGTGWVFNGGTTEHYFLSNCTANGNTVAPWSYATGAAVHCSGGNFSVWVPLTPNNNWANSGIGPNAAYCWRGSDIEIIADVTPTVAGSIVAGTGIFNLPSVAFPAHQQTLTIQDQTNRAAQAQLNVGTGGSCTFFQGIGAVAVNDRCAIHGFISTDA